MAECSTIYCDSCEYHHITTQATKWCTDCEQGYCDECVKAHQVNRSLHDLHTIPAKDYFKTSSMTQTKICQLHNKAFDFFCPAHDSILCITCIQTAHTGCKDILAIETAAKDAKTSPLVYDVESSLSVILENIEMGIKHHKKNVTFLGEDETEVKNEMKQFRIDVNKALDAAEEKLAKSIARKQSIFLPVIKNAICKLQKKKREFTSLKERVSNMKTVGSDLQVFVGLRQINVTIHKESELVRSLLNRCKQYRLQLNINQETTLSTLGSVEVQTNPAPVTCKEPKSSQAQMLVPVPGNAKVGEFTLKQEISIEKETGKQLTLTCCQIIPNNGLVFGDYWSKRLIFYDEDGTYNDAFRMNAHVSNITCITSSKVAVSHGFDGSFVEVINTDIRFNEKTMSFAQTIGGITFHDEKLYLDVLGDTIYISDLNAKITSTIPVGKTPKLKRLEILGNNIYYADQTKHKVVCCDMMGNTIWEFQDNRIVEKACVTLDESGNVYVTGYDANVILKISSKGKECKVILDNSNKIHKPVGIHCDRKRKWLLVCNENNGYAALYAFG